MNTGSNYFVSGRVVPCDINKETGFEDGAMVLFFGEFSADPSFSSFFYGPPFFLFFFPPKKPYALRERKEQIQKAYLEFVYPRTGEAQAQSGNVLLLPFLCSL